MSLQGQLNRLLGTSGVEAQRAANELAGTSGKEILFALNTIAGTAGKGIIYVMHRIVQLNNPGEEYQIEAEGEPWESGSDPLGAMDNLPTGSIVVGGFDSVILAFSSAFTGKYVGFRDAAGVTY